MARVSIYLNFSRNTEEVFNFYKSVFGGEFTGEIDRMGIVPAPEGMSPLAEADMNLVMHINLEPDTLEETQRLFDALSSGGPFSQELSKAFWGAYYGSCTDKYCVQWMFNFYDK